MTEPDDTLGEIRQRRHLEQLVARARRLREHLGPLLEAHSDRVHFRPTAQGVDMVSLLPERPFAVRPAIKSLSRFAARFEQEFREHCLEKPLGRVSIEQRLQAFVIRQAYSHGRRLSCLGEAAQNVVFVTDNVTVPHVGRRFASDLLAIEEGAAPTRAVVIEVGRSRGATLNVQRVVDYAAIVDRQAAVFGELFGALLGRPIHLDRAAARWILWPPASEPDTLEERLAERGVRVVEFVAEGDGFRFRMGRPA